MQKLAHALLSSLALLLCACDEKHAPARAGLDTRFDIGVGGRTVQARVTCTDEERQNGLMHVESMPEHEGMLFLARRPIKHGFWMKNTLIPLDIGYFTGDGVLREVHPMYPRNLDRVESRRDDIRYALEMNQGWFRSNGVGPGDRLDLEAVSRAIRSRGYDPATWID